MRHKNTKYYSMLASGTLSSLLVTAVLMADTFIAGLMLEEHGVAGINLVMPIYSLSSFFVFMFSLGDTKPLKEDFHYEKNCRLRCHSTCCNFSYYCV